MPTYLCPECAQNKTQNCTGMALDVDDNFVECHTAVALAEAQAATYAGTTGHSGTDTSRERAEREVADGSAADRTMRILNWIKNRGSMGATVHELDTLFPQWHHGKISSTLTNAHRAGALARLNATRDRCKVYVHPDYVGDRRTEEPGRNRSSTGLAVAELEDRIRAGLRKAGVVGRISDEALTEIRDEILKDQQ